MRDIKFIQSDQRMLVINSTSSGKQHSSHSATRAQVSLIHPHLFWQSEWHVMTAGAWPLSSFTPDCHRSSGSLESQRARQPSPQPPPPAHCLFHALSSPQRSVLRLQQQQSRRETVTAVVAATVVEKAANTGGFYRRQETVLCQYDHWC